MVESPKKLPILMNFCQTPGFTRSRRVVQPVVDPELYVHITEEWIWPRRTTS